MRKIILFILITLSVCDLFSKTPRDTALHVLYRSMENKYLYTSNKESQIAQTKKMLETPRISDEQRYDINLRLYNEYKTYISDSAIYYVRENVQIAERLNNPTWKYETKLDLVSLYVITGMFLEATDALKSINRKHLNSDWLLIKYFDCYKQLYSFYASNNSYTRGYSEKSKLYRDSLLSVLDEDSNHYKIVYAEKLYDESKLNEAKEILLELLKETGSDTHEKAVLSYALANIYKKEGDIDLQMQYYAMSAACDIKNSIKENASMQALASILYETGNVEKAYACIKSSMEDAMFCNARLRTHEVSQIFPIIDSAYQENVARKKSELQLFLLLVSILSLFLLVAIIYVYRQMKRIARIRKEVYRANVKLNELNSDLQLSNAKLNNVNKELSNVNTELSEANQIKEAYIGHFLDLCSTYINKIESYQNTLRKKAADKKLEELYKILRSREMIDNELKALYDNFDNIFLHLYPNFVSEFNSLLLKEERFQLKPNELLNVELRIFALIRLGITDSSKIANFLHYSANTIYTYRTRTRNKSAVPRDQFENMVMKIGVIKPN